MAREKPDRTKVASRVVLEGEDALGNVAALLSAKAAGADQSADGLRAFAEALRATGGELSGSLQNLSRLLEGRSWSGLLDEVRELERRDPDAFVAGALAGFSLGLLAGSPPSRRETQADDPADRAKGGELRGGFASDGDSAYPGPDQPAPGDAGVVTAPVGTAQTGAGGLGYLEPATDDETERRKGEG